MAVVLSGRIPPVFRTQVNLTQPHLSLLSLISYVQLLRKRTLGERVTFIPISPSLTFRGTFWIAEVVARGSHKIGQHAAGCNALALREIADNIDPEYDINYFAGAIPQRLCLRTGSIIASEHHGPNS